MPGCHPEQPGPTHSAVSGQPEVAKGTGLAVARPRSDGQNRPFPWNF